MASPLPSATLHRLIGAVSDLHSIDDGETFSTRAIRTSSAIVQGELNVYTEIDPAAGRVLFAADRGHAELAAVESDFLRLQHQHPGIQRQVNAGEFGVHAVSRLLTTREWKSLDLYHDVYKKMGVEDQVVVCAPLPAPTALGVTISRSRRGFKSAEIAALQIYEKHFTRAFEVQQRFDDQAWLAGSLAGGQREGEGFAIANGDGVPLLACPTAETLMARYFSVKRTGARLLPGPIRHRMACLSSNDENSLRTSPVLRMTRGAHELRIDFRRHERLNRWVLRFEEQTPDDRRRNEANSFSPRLRSVLELLRKGHSEKEIAHELGLAASTIHDYVKQIFKRLGVHSRSELMALWVRDLPDASPKGE